MNDYSSQTIFIVLFQSPHRLENGLQNGSYPSELVPRELHMVSICVREVNVCFSICYTSPCEDAI